MKGSYSVARQFSDEDPPDEPRQSGHKKVIRYIGSIRNPFKKHYAEMYYKFLMGETYKPDDSKISYLAAQSVRLRLMQYLNL